MSKEGKEKKTTYETLKAMYFSGKVKPSLNKIIAELEDDSKNLELTLLACKCLVRSKDFDTLSSYADTCIKLDPKNTEGYFYKGVACQHIKGKEQEALKNFNDALVLNPEHTVCLKSKADTHLLLYTDYHLPVKFAEKHRDKAETCLMKIIELLENKEGIAFAECLTLGDTFTSITQNINAKKFYGKAVTAFEAADEDAQDKNIYKDIIKAQKACIKLIEKFTE